ncbi:MAG: ATP-binding cassette domain-containing protein [Acholeplasmataceae bacterium]
MEPILKTNNLSKKYRDTLALDNVTMTVNKGDIYGLVGENGAGKSTLFKVITNTALKSGGEFTYYLDNYKGNLAAIIENPAIHGSLSAMDNLRFQNNLLGLNKSINDLENLLKKVGLKNLIDSKKRAKHFSLGMKQRLGISLLLISDPQFIILDEPMNGLDPLGIKHMRNIILDLNKNHNITFIVSSHILSELDKIATNYGFISKGKLIKELSDKELKEIIKPVLKISFKNEIDNNLLNYLSKYEFIKLDLKTISISNNLDQSTIIKELSNLGYDILSIIEEKNDIESYYLNLIGDNTNE